MTRNVLPDWLVRLSVESMIETEKLHAKKLAEKKIVGS
jgi:hypothetical protein